jgi:hypothetical protein
MDILVRNVRLGFMISVAAPNSLKMGTHLLTLRAGMNSSLLIPCRIAIHLDGPGKAEPAVSLTQRSTTSSLEEKILLSVSSNTGAVYDSPIMRKGHSIDHIPVHISVRIKSIAARVGTNKVVSSFKYDKAELQKAVRTLQTIRSNAMQNNPDPVDAESSAKVDAY